MDKNISTDVLVIGGGAAALRVAIEAAALGVKVALVDKGEFGERLQPHVVRRLCYPFQQG